MNHELGLLAAFVIGLLGSTHCIGMCGGIMGAISVSSGSQCQNRFSHFNHLLLYNIGRILSYAIAGTLLGASAQWLSQEFTPAGKILRTLAGLLVIAMGLYICGWWLGLRYMERAGSRLWGKLQPAFNRLLPARQSHKALIAGMIWGWLPCGLVYSTLSWSAASTNALQGGLLMLFFGLGTLPAVLAMGLFFSRLKDFLQQRWLRQSAGVLLIVFGIWTIPPVNQLMMPATGQHQNSDMDSISSQETESNNATMSGMHQH